MGGNSSVLLGRTDRTGCVLYVKKECAYVRACVCMCVCMWVDRRLRELGEGVMYFKKSNVLDTSDHVPLVREKKKLGEKRSEKR